MNIRRTRSEPLMMSGGSPRLHIPQLRLNIRPSRYNFQDILTEASRYRKFPDHRLVDPFLSMGKLTEHGCNDVKFKKDTVEVTNSEGITILMGQKPVERTIYTVPLSLGKS